MTGEELMEKIEKEEIWLLYVLNDKGDMASSYDVDIAFDAVKYYVKDYIDSQQKVGKWIRMKAYEKWGCSECNTVFRFTFKEHDYCPNCGAKMQEVEE